MKTKAARFYSERLFSYKTELIFYRRIFQLMKLRFQPYPGSFQRTEAAAKEYLNIYLHLAAFFYRVFLSNTVNGEVTDSGIPQ